MHIIGLDCGATKIEFVLTDTNDIIRPKIKFRVPTPKNSSYQKFLDCLVNNINKIVKDSNTKIEKVGIGLPGIINPLTKIIQQSSIKCCDGHSLEDDLEKALQLKVIVANDSKCFALSEATLGAGINYKNVIGLILGSGMAMGYVVDKHLFFGSNGITGEVGHWVIHPHGVKCYCGSCGCMETLVSGRALERLYFETTGENKLARAIYEEYLQNKNNARLTMLGYLEYFGICISQIINLFDPDAIIIGGGLSNMDLIFTIGPQYIAKHTFGENFNTPIIKNKLGDASGVFGACLLEKI